jgi:hypothetical protein
MRKGIWLFALLLFCAVAHASPGEVTAVVM